MNITSILKFKSSSITKFGSNSCNDTYFSSLQTIDFKNNPSETKRDEYLGQQIQLRVDKLAVLNEQLNSETDEFKREKLEEQISKIEREKDLYVNDLTERHLKFAVSAAHRFALFLPNAHFNDLVSSANVGLMKAARKYSPEKYPGINFISYAKHWIKNQIHRDYAQEHQVRIPVGAGMFFRKIQRLQQEYLNKFDRFPTEDELAKHFNVSVKKIKDTLLNANVSLLSLNSDINDEDSDATYSNFFADEQEEAQREKLMRQDDLNYMKAIIEKYLTPKEKYILKERFKVGQLDADENLVVLNTLAQKFGITRERVRQIQNLAIAKIRRIMDNEQYDPQKDKKIQDKVTSLKVFKPVEKTDLEEKVLLQFFINELTEGEPIEVKNRLAEQIKGYKFNDFKALLDEYTPPKGRQVLELLFFRENNLTQNQIAEKFDICKAAVVSRKYTALAAIKRHLLQKDDTNYLCLKQSIIQKLINPRSFKATSKRIERAEHQDIYKILNKILPSVDKEYLVCKYGLNEKVDENYSVKTNYDVAKIFNTTEDVVARSINKTLDLLKEYYSKPTELNDNLSAFAAVVVAGISNPEIRERASAQIKSFDKRKLNEFLNLVLNKTEKMIIAKRHNLDSYNSTKTLVVSQRELMKCLPEAQKRQDISKIISNAFDKITKYFEYGYISNSKVFIEDVLSYIDDENKKEDVKKKLIFKSDEEILNMLDEALGLEQAEQVKKRYKLYPDEIENIDENKLVRNKSMRANVEKITEFLNKGLASNLEVFAKSIAEVSPKPENKQKIFDIVSARSIEEINSDLKDFLSPFEYKVMKHYFSIDEFHQVMPEHQDVQLLANEVGKTKSAIYATRKNALAKLNKFYQNGIPTNIKYFIETLASTSSDAEFAEFVLKEFDNASIYKINSVMSRCLSEQEREILSQRYSLDKVIEFYKQPQPLSVIGEKFGYSLTKTYKIEINAFFKILSYLKSWENK